MEVFTKDNKMIITGNIKSLDHYNEIKRSMYNIKIVEVLDSISMISRVILLLKPLDITLRVNKTLVGLLTDVGLNHQVLRS